MKTRFNFQGTFLFLLLITSVILLFIFDIFTGPVKIPFSNIIQSLFRGTSGKAEWDLIITSFRVPKAITAILAGSALSVSGLQMQTMFRNPLAGPYVLGISSGASLGVAVVIMGFTVFLGFSPGEMLQNWIVIIAAWLGGGLVLFLVFIISMRINDIMTILVLGMMIGSISTALVGAMQYFSSEAMVKSFMVWSMGSLSSVGISHLYLLIPSVLAGLIIALLSVKMLNLLLLGENYARTMGLNVKLSRFLIFLSTSILAGSITAFCGPIGFIGIAVPHICRLMFKTSDQKILLFASMLTGSSLMLLSDLISQLPGKGVVFPINTVTAFLGIPVVVYIILRNQKISALN